MRRSGRRGWLERLLGVLYVFPFRCQLCQHRFQALEWGARYSRVEGRIDRREYDRVPTRLPVAFAIGDTRGAGVLTDLSTAGARLEADASLAEGDVLQLTIRDRGGQTSVTLDLVAVRSGGTRRVGLQFPRLDQADRERLAGLVQEALRAAPSAVSAP